VIPTAAETVPDLAWDALGDPTRRRVLEVLRDGPRPVVEIAARLPVSRPAVSQHLAVLKEAGLVMDRKDGRRNLYRIDPNGLTTLRTYLESMWDDVLAAFANAAERAGGAKEQEVQS
jgi:DNA-binding transcriptional ArsR family regulator